MGPLLALLGLLLAVLVGAALLQLSVAGANRLAGGSPAARPYYRDRARDLDSEWDKLTWEEWDAAREPFDPEPERPKGLIPKPHLGIGMAVVFLTGAVGLLAFVLINFGLEDASGRRRRDQSGPAFLLTLPVAYFAMSVMLVGFLPTTFRRGLLVALVFALSLLAFFLCVGALIFVIGVGLR
jgi:hypothetical protein